MPTPTLSRGKTTRTRGRLGLSAALAAAAFLSSPASAQDGRTPESQKAKANPDRAAETEASRFCANAAPSVAEARIAWQTKRLGELDAQVKQRLADLEKAEASVQEWVAKRDTMLKAASDDLVAIYTRMQPENAAIQLRPPRTISESRCAGERRVDSGRRDSGSRRTLVSRMA